uniref:uncharacterized protein LOC122609329 n=1 Tax=Erigeron canadensis TaxID=72917 RepID=UPI001CB9B5C6|nr:uncharacterized protein LOC122609329 [Erigeron canadensis]
MSSITEKLEKIFFDNLEKDDLDQVNELVQLLSLSDEECEQRFSENKELKNKYFPYQEKIFTIQKPKIEEPETEDDSFDDMEVEEEEEPIEHKINRNQTQASSSKRSSYSNTKSEFSMPYHKGIPNSNNNGNSQPIDTIKIDCIFDFERRKEIIDKWNTEISLIIQSNPNEFSHARTVLLLVEHKSSGIIQNMIKGTNWNIDLHGGDLYYQIIGAIYMMFLGLDFVTNRDQENGRIQEKARQALTKAQICDMCLLEDFTCLFEQNLYKLSTSEYHNWIEIYLMKIPIVGVKAKERWNKEKNDLTKHSLGFATKIVKKEIAIICDLANTQKQLKRFNKNCCTNLTDIPPLSYGCNIVKDKKYFKNKYKKKYDKPTNNRRFWKPKKKTFTPGKYFSKEKPKVCPQGKKDCRCWICSEEGHYANECPNRQNFPNKVKLILEAEKDGYFPSEDNFKGVTKVYVKSGIH